jgi:hypothetical protein
MKQFPVLGRTYFLDGHDLEIIGHEFKKIWKCFDRKTVRPSFEGKSEIENDANLEGKGKFYTPILVF